MNSWDLLIFYKFQKVFAGQKGVFGGQSVAGLFHVFDDLFSWNQTVFREAELARRSSSIP